MKTKIALSSEEKMALDEIYLDFRIPEYTEAELDEMERLNEIKNRTNRTPHEL